MNTKQLTYLLTIATEQNISHAAEKLFISRPALNNFLTGLESELGVSLFKRVNRKMLPTHAGEVYIENARRMLDLEKQTAKRMDEIRGCTSGELSLGVTVGGGARMFSHVFPEFHRRYPNFSVNLRENNIRHLDALILEGQIDLAVSGYPDTPNPQLEYIDIVQDEVLLALPRNHRYAHLAAPAGEPLALFDLNLLKDDFWVLTSKSTRTREIHDQYLAEHGIVPKVIVECAQNYMCYSLIRDGVAPGFVMKSTVNPADGVPCFRLTPTHTWHSCIAFRPGTAFTEAELFFIELVRQYFQQQSPFSTSC